jgi:hypothetical protein
MSSSYNSHDTFFFYIFIWILKFTLDLLHLECALVLLAFSKLYEPDWIAFLKALFPTKKKGFENKKRKLFLVVLDVKILFLPFISLFF